MLRGILVYAAFSISGIDEKYYAARDNSRNASSPTDSFTEPLDSRHLQKSSRSLVFTPFFPPIQGLQTHSRASVSWECACGKRKRLSSTIIRHPYVDVPVTRIDSHCKTNVYIVQTLMQHACNAPSLLQNPASPRPPASDLVTLQ